MGYDDNDDDNNGDDDDDDDLVTSAATTTVNCVSGKVKNVGKEGLWVKVTQNNKKKGTRIKQQQLDNTLTTFPHIAHF